VNGPHPRPEVEAAVRAYLDHRERLDRGEADWAEVADFFTEDAVFVDAAWGRVEGRAAIAELMTTAMAGLEGFTYPTDAVAIEGDDVLVAWRQVVAGLELRGGPFQHTGVSILRYAGEGRFSFEEDLMNVALVGTDLMNAGWEPGPDFTMPPPDVPR
jgi:ketosteroid isomerase-like protein